MDEREGLFIWWETCNQVCTRSWTCLYNVEIQRGNSSLASLTIFTIDSWYFTCPFGVWHYSCRGIGSEMVWNDLARFTIHCFISFCGAFESISCVERLWWIQKAQYDISPSHTLTSLEFNLFYECILWKAFRDWHCNYTFVAYFYL